MGVILKEISQKVAEIYMSGDHLVGQERHDHVVAVLKEYEASWT